MKTYRMKGPGGAVLETTAPSPAKAEANFRWRLRTQFGLSAYEARKYDCRDVREVRHG